MIKKYWTFMLLGGILFLTLLAYSNSLHGEFQFDDDNVIVFNPALKDFSRFLDRAISIDGLLRQRVVADLTFIFNYWLGGLNVFGYHVLNLIIHIINGLLVYRLVTLIMCSDALPEESRQRASDVAILSSAIFLLHPAQTQAVNYISQRYESLASLFYLVSLIAYIEARMQDTGFKIQDKELKNHASGIVNHVSGFRSPALYAVSVVSGILALGSKEMAVTIPVVLLLYEIYFMKDRPFLKRLVGPGIFILLLFVSGIYILLEAGKWINAGFSIRAFTPWEYLMTQFRVLIRYIGLLFFPANQNVDYDLTVSSSFFEADTFLSFAFLSVLFVAALLLFKKWRTGSFFMLWFFIVLAPTSSIIPITDVIFEHRVYLASLGIIVAFVDSFFFFGVYKFIKNRFSGSRLIMLSAALTLVLVLSVMTFQRNRVWQTKLSLWEDVVKKSPMKARGHNGLANCYLSQGRYAEAINEYGITLSLDRFFIEAYYNMGESLDSAGRPGEAVYYYDVFCRNAPEKYEKEKENACKRVQGG